MSGLLRNLFRYVLQVPQAIAGVSRGLYVRMYLGSQT